jgi:hypothetical protein
MGITASFLVGQPLGFLTKTYRQGADTLYTIIQKEIRDLGVEMENAVKRKEQEVTDQIGGRLHQADQEIRDRRVAIEAKDESVRTKEINQWFISGSGGQIRTDLVC